MATRPTRHQASLWKPDVHDHDCLPPAPVTGTNPRQINAIADGVQETLRTEFGERPHLAEGIEKSQWILLDYFNFVVHVFSRECRAFYELERLWGNAERYEFSDEE